MIHSPPATCSHVEDSELSIHLETKVNQLDEKWTPSGRRKNCALLHSILASSRVKTSGRLLETIVKFQTLGASQRRAIFRLLR